LKIPKEVDLRVMLTFLDFYCTLLGFVNFKLFSENSLKYPPKIDIHREENGGGLVACVLESCEEDSLHLAVNVADQSEGSKLVKVR
jgi:pescadillo protein